MELNVLGCRVDILGTNCDQCVCMVQCCFKSTETIRLIGDRGEGEEGGMEVREEGEYIPIAIHCHHQNDSCIKLGSDEIHFNVSVGSNGQSHKMASYR